MHQSSFESGLRQHESTWVTGMAKSKYLKKRVIAGSNLCEVRQLLHRRLRMFARREWPATIGAGGSRGCSKIRPHGEAVTSWRRREWRENRDLELEDYECDGSFSLNPSFYVAFSILMYFKCNIMQHGSVLQSQSEQYQLPKTVQLNRKAYVGRCSVDRASSIHRALCGSIWQLGTLSFGTWCFWWSKHQNYW